MSEVLKALEQSQKQFEQASIQGSGQAHLSSRPQAGKGKMKLVVAIAVGLGVGVAAHSLLSGSATTRTIEAMLSPALNSVLVVEEAPIATVADTTPSFDIVYLPAEPAKPLLPLPKIMPAVVTEEPKPVTETAVASSTTRAKASSSTPKVEPKAKIASSPSKKESDDEWNLSKLDLSQLSPELAGRITSALDEPSDTDKAESHTHLDHTKNNELDKNTARYKGRLPALNLQTHMYASNPKHRLVKINGKELQEGEMINDQTKLVEIAPRYVVVEFAGETIQIPALYDWHG
ncbi:general secretion pathway protein GspB [Vibrio ezurae]|uniref:Type II secretion system protein GspB C-terminal domain-containing protein n=1 Tax=Vibrio ezurae NBRC 102218 TaxID=1219080 RepID=U3CHG9_9VIBR|nr:general secretion pathway protein GspB [Vibrio ezurae]GAD80644.1 hypothetical protein VEZ01S_38_00330 [Vibrio ezurae NBRC 102218]